MKKYLKIRAQGKEEDFRVQPRTRENVIKVTGKSKIMKHSLKM